MNDGQPPRLVVYVPIEREKTHSALIELDSAGVVMQPRQQPPTCNTRLSVVARNALKPILGEDQVAEIERQVEAGKLSLADLNSLADKGKDISTGVLTLIFGSANPQEVALAFLHDDHHDEEIEKKAAQKELRHLLQVSFDIELPAAEACRTGGRSWPGMSCSPISVRRPEEACALLAVVGFRGPQHGRRRCLRAAGPDMAKQPGASGQLRCRGQQGRAGVCPRPT